MLNLRPFFPWALLPTALILSCGACHGDQPGPISAESIETSNGLLTDFDIFPVDERKALPDGESDLTNRYTFTVMIQVPTTSGKTITCSGVLVTPRLVLTAGHCVCAGHTSPESGNS